MEDGRNFRDFQSLRFRKVEEDQGEEDGQDDGERHERELGQLRLKKGRDRLIGNFLSRAIESFGRQWVIKKQNPT